MACGKDIEPIGLVPADEIDLRSFVRLQKRAFAAHLNQYDVDDSYLNEGYFRWKYAPPAGVGRVAVASGVQGYTATAAAVPLRIGNPDRQTVMWRLVDIATDPESRGRGLYSAMLNRLIDSLSGNEVLAAFPNKNSTRGFQKAGCTDACYVPTWVSPALPGKRRHPAVAELQSFADLETKRWYGRLVPQATTSILRDAQYLNWRYQEHPEFEYCSYMYDNDEEGGYIVFRAAEVFGRRALYILELWATGRHARSRLLGMAHRHCRERGLSWIVAVTNGITGLQGLNHCFVSVPRRLVPKKQILRGVCSDEASRAVFHSPWRVQMGDLLEF